MQTITLLLLLNTPSNGVTPPPVGAAIRVSVGLITQQTRVSVGLVDVETRVTLPE